MNAIQNRRFIGIYWLSKLKLLDKEIQFDLSILKVL